MRHPVVTIMADRARLQAWASALDAIATSIDDGRPLPDAVENAIEGILDDVWAAREKALVGLRLLKQEIDQ